MSAQKLLDINIDRYSDLPLHLQLREGIRREIKHKHLRPGDRLPTVQTLVRNYRLSISTVTRALSDLTREGVLVSRRGSGTFVADYGVRGIEILIPGQKEPNEPSVSGFYHQILEGLRAELDNDHRLCLSYVDGYEVTARELLTICTARRADGLIVYRPKEPRLTRELRIVAEKIPVVSLLWQMPDPNIDCVLPDIADSLRKMLKQKIEKGLQVFAFASFSSLIETSQPNDKSLHHVYKVMFDTFMNVMEEAGIEPIIRLSTNKNLEDAKPELVKLSEDIPDGAVLVTSSPHIAMLIEGTQKHLDKIAYTESRETLATHRGYVSMLYLGLDTVAREAAKQILSKRQNPEKQQSKIRFLRPEIIEAANGENSLRQ